MRKPNLPKLAIAGGVAACLLAAAVPIVAFGVVPLFVRSTVHEAAPSAAVRPSPGGPAPTAVREVPAVPVVLATGMLRKVDPVHYGSGQVTILDADEARYLRFEGVAIAGAPNMFVYLSDRSDGMPGTFTDLGPLKATDGSFNYPLPSTADLTRIHSVVVWCRAFNVTVTYAELAG